MLKYLEKLFGAKRQKDVQALYPVVEEINEWYEQYQSLSDEELRAKTDEFRSRIRARIGEEDDRLAELNARLKEGIEPDEKDAVLNEIADLEKSIYETTQEVLDELLPEAFAVVK